MEVKTIVEEARHSFKAGITRSLEWRRLQLDSVLLLLRQELALIQDSLFKDLGKTPFHAYTTEISVVENACRLAKRKLKKWASPTRVGSNLLTFPSRASIVPEPLGLVLIIGSWNFPFALVMDPLIGAIVAGNAAVVKPSEIAPATSNMLLRLLPQYLDSSAIKAVVGDASVGSALLDLKWDKIFFTGSSRVGKMVMSKAAKHLCPVTLELGGKCPALVDSTVDLKVVARRIIYGKWGLNNGQACISVDYVLAVDSIMESLIEMLKKTLEEFYGKEPWKCKDLSKIVNYQNLSRLQEMLREPGVVDNIVLGGRCFQDELFMEPTIVSDPPQQTSVMEEEIFGPILVILKVNSMEEAISFVNDRPKPLAAYVFTNSKSVKHIVKNRVSAGAICFNDTILHFSIQSLPFGGVGESGMGCYHGKFSFNAFSHQKAVLDRNTNVRLGFEIPPIFILKDFCSQCSLQLSASILEAFSRPFMWK
eukprot:TRINITY_DN1658_c0_g1_i1.p1 TRINITY_DN1658_c0_g1~~TRINITY_DN1658_c0_g1_i1.p1  ORF type:complete len:478 (-),score=92.26 TRINITY_DN1658_c0_g1_i1:344-1777(-)